MPGDFSKRDPLLKRAPARPWARYASRVIAGAALVYALLAGLHTLEDFDLGWQLASGRWIAQHHSVFSTDVFSYTAAGQPWVYPALSSLISYWTFLLGGYGLLSWLGAAACAGTVALLLRSDSLAASVLCLVAVPLIANRTQPRAEMFTVILFAAFLSLLWSQYRTGRARLWLLPVLMVLWVNLHLGFIAGLALCIAYVLMEVAAAANPAVRTTAVARLRSAWPWLVATAAATFVNPWEVSIYRALVRQQSAQAFHNLWVVEWEGVRPSWGSLRQVFDVRDPQSAFWWLAIAAVLASVVALWRREWGAACILGGSTYVAFQHARLQALFACVVVVIGGALLAELGRGLRMPQPVMEKARQPAGGISQLQTGGISAVLIACVALAGVRGWDLISNRYYLRSNRLALFGTGLSWWFPEKAVDFLKREKLPGNIFNGYTLGGYLEWRLFPAYRDYIDSRAIPFGRDLFLRAYDLASEAPDSAAWEQEASARDINTIIVPLSRYQGMTLFPKLHHFCRNLVWSPVYMDEVSAIFVRRTPETEAVIERSQINCDQLTFRIPQDEGNATSARDRAELFNAWANAGGVLYSLERYPEGMSYLDRAESAFPENADVHLLRALVFQEMNRPGHAEAEFRASLVLQADDETSVDLGLFYMTQKRYADAAAVFQKSAEGSSRPHEMWMMYGQAELQMKQPKVALDAFGKAEAASPFQEGDALGSAFNSLVATGRAKACYQLGDMAQAVSFQEDAVRLAPHDAKLWLGLADLYYAAGRNADAAQARLRAMGR
jgi:Tfp pilus assembly protein PilF